MTPGPKLIAHNVDQIANGRPLDQTPLKRPLFVVEKKTWDNFHFDKHSFAIWSTSILLSFFPTNQNQSNFPISLVSHRMVTDLVQSNRVQV